MLLIIVAPNICVFWSFFRNAVISVLSSFATLSPRKREQVTLLYVRSCYVT